MSPVSHPVLCLVADEAVYAVIDPVVYFETQLIVKQRTKCFNMLWNFSIPFKVHALISNKFTVCIESSKYMISSQNVFSTGTAMQPSRGYLLLKEVLVFSELQHCSWTRRSHNDTCSYHGCQRKFTFCTKRCEDATIAST